MIGLNRILLCLNHSSQIIKKNRYFSLNQEGSITISPEICLWHPGGGGGFSESVKMVGVPAGNFHDKPLKIPANFRQPPFHPLKIPKFKTLKIPCFESTPHTQKRGKITENKVRESLKCVCA